MTKNPRAITDDMSDVGTQELSNSLPSFFSFLGDVEHTAYLNWRFDYHDDVESQFFSMGKGYFETSIALVEQCIADNRRKRADIWIFPILFNVVHGIELYLKGFNSLYQVFTELEETGELLESKIEGKHDIRQLCQVAIKRLRKNADPEIIEEMMFVKTFIEILYQNTNDMTFARYPITSKKENHFYVGTHENVTIDLNVLRQWILRLSSVLENVTGYISYLTDQLKDMRADMLY